MLTTSPLVRRARPIQAVELTIAIAAGGQETAQLKKAYPAARRRRGLFELTISGRDPSKVAQEARGFLEELKLATKQAKEFK